MRRFSRIFLCYTLGGRMIKPLPCPFCGNIPIVGPENPEIDGNAHGYVRCLSCAVSPGVSDGIDVCDDRGSDKYKEAAIIRWNKRA